MGWDPTVNGFGPYKPELEDVLPYPIDWYRGVPVGTIISGCIGGLYTKSQGEELAGLCGIDIDSMDWEVTLEKMKKAKLDILDVVYGEVVETYKNCVKLLNHGWRLFFDPCA